MGVDREDPLRRLGPVHSRQVHIHEYEIGVQLLREIDRLLTARGLADDLEVPGGLDNVTRDRAERLLVVDDQYSDSHQVTSPGT